MMSILVLGGAGFIGSSIVNKLVNCNYRVIVFDRKGADISRILPSDKVSYIYNDLSDIDFLTDFIQKENIHVVIHLVSSLIPNSSFDEYNQDVQNVVFPSIKLIHELAKLQVLFVYFSSGGTIYGNKLYERSINENDTLMPINYYGYSKLMMERMILVEHNLNKLRYLILRPSNPYGPGQNLYGKQGLIAVALGKCIREEEMVVYGDGSVVRDYIYIDDLTNCVCELLNRNVENRIFNLGSGCGYSINDVLSVMEEVTGKKLQIRNYPERLVDVHSLVLDISKLDKVIGFHGIPLKEGIYRFLKYIGNDNK